MSALEPWKATFDSGYGTTYWTLQRPNPRFIGGRETMMNMRGGDKRRWKSEAAAAKAATKENAIAKATTKAGDGEQGGSSHE